MFRRAQESEDVDALISKLLGKDAPIDSPATPDESAEEFAPFTQQQFYQLPLKHTKGGALIDEQNKAWVVGHFYPGKFLNETHPGGHNGVDLKAPKGSPILSIGPGVITKVVSDWKAKYGVQNCGDYGEKTKQGIKMSTAGNLVAIEHEDGKVTSLYLHLDETKVSVGQEVGMSTVIGTVGETGNAMCRGDHLHYEVRVDGALVDPSKVVGKPVGSLSKKAEFIKKLIGELEKRSSDNTLRKIAENVGFDFNKD